ncbi:ScbA/BarX family gamma-butyrolactone biosynthesis protein [Streptomyces roseoverticillatus]|uniref:ScbA/BarX family gamma-butyrolactone biosynthesis protein n=1 Tax=Streptomyces roseoverticillatus TaxID=66429 RepID=UPI0033EA1042
MSQILLRPAADAVHGIPRQFADHVTECRLVRLEAGGTHASGGLQVSPPDLSAHGAHPAHDDGVTGGGTREGATGGPAAEERVHLPGGPAAKELVHLSFDDAVFVTRWEQQDPTHYTVTGSWPAHTTHHVPGHGTHYEALTVAQTIRQASLLLAHTAFEAPLSHATLLHTFNYTLNRAAALDTERATPLHIDVTATPTTVRNKRVTALHVTMTVTAAGPAAADGKVSGPVLATGETTFEWIPPAVYRRLRGAHHQPPSELPPLTPHLPPASVGRNRPDEVLLSPTGRPGEWQLRHPFDNTVFYDHGVDHVPGLVLIEAADQAVFTTTAPMAGTAGTCACDPAAGSGYRPQPATTHTTFHRYAEFDAPVNITTERHTTSRTTTRTTVGHQNGEAVFTTTHTGPAA